MKAVVNFIKEKETKNTIKYTEIKTPENKEIIGSLYIQKHFADNANKIKITIEIND